MKAFASFMASAAGRGIRIVAGIALIAWGIFGMAGSTGYIVAAIGLLPLATGILNICIIAPIFGGPLKGSDA